MDVLLAHCSAFFSAQGGLFAAFFLGGLTGSITHCLGMCGPLVAGQSACAGACGGRSVKISPWAYHIGRFTSYGALGFAAAFFAMQLSAFSFWPVLSSLMLVGAGVMFFLSSLPGRSFPRCQVSARTSYARGVLMGFMPCGLLYAALMMAATLANPMQGMVAMWLFVLGTLPVLLVVQFGAQSLAQKWKRGADRLGRAAMAFNGLLLMAMAVKLVR